jgi:hypothetical protein
MKIKIILLRMMHKSFPKKSFGSGFLTRRKRSLFLSSPLFILKEPKQAQRGALIFKFFLPPKVRKRAKL